MNSVQFFKALADETRLAILLMIVHEQELCVCELVQALGDSQPKISRHLALLKKAGLLSDRKTKQWVYYRLSDNLAEWQAQIIQSTLSNNLESVELKLTNMTDRPAMCC
ncbi:metalloregulator ArsR/SmtB family transcription factor [Thalassotalea crassostreae]|uniref:metalloregulator ArsR/SmtB family transcription factor n=1 Tax=Thalassotalea crassostreae TaxID=1763536 RepID=UPI000838C9C3|nr:metalloregulator ArsR/SmtB family transcription factor [Thalassotalea crassostreae]